MSIESFRATRTTATPDAALTILGWDVREEHQNPTLVHLYEYGDGERTLPCCIVEEPGRFTYEWVMMGDAWRSTRAEAEEALLALMSRWH